MPRDQLGQPRREILRQLALATTALSAGVFNIEAARVVHALAGEARTQLGSYDPVELTVHEFRTVSRLAELIVPADDRGGSAVDAGAPEFIDLLCSQNEQLASIYRNGITWLDDVMRTRHKLAFVDARDTEQTQMLDNLVEAERGRGPRNIRVGVDFFAWVRRMTVDAYYTSPIGIADIGFQGNKVLSTYTTPSDVVAFVNKAADDLGL